MKNVTEISGATPAESMQHCELALQGVLGALFTTQQLHYTEKQCFVIHAVFIHTQFLSDFNTVNTSISFQICVTIKVWHF